MHCHSSLPNDLRPGGIGRCADCATRFACIGSGLATEPLRRLATLLSRSERLLPGSHLYRPGDAADYQFHVRTGTIKTYVLSANGDERVTGFYLAGEVLSNSQIEGARTEGAVALETATVCRLRIKDIGRLEEIDRLPALMLKMAQQDTRRGQHQINLAGTAAPARFAGFCLQYSGRLTTLRRSATHLPLPMTRSDIASYLGMTLESLSRAATKLSKAGLIRTSRTELVLLDPDGLKALAVQGTY